MAVSDDLGAIIQGGGSRRRGRWIVAGIVVALAVAAGTYWATHRTAAATTIQPQPVAVTRGTLAITTSTTGTAAASKSSDLTFSAGGIVTAVNVKPGDTVTQGQVLAQLDPTDAQRSLASAQASFQAAQLKLQALISPPAYASDVASANQSVASAQAALLNAQKTLASLENPSQADIDSAHQAVLSAEASLSTAEQNLTALQNPTPPTAADISAADAAVTSGQVSVTNAQNQVAGALPALNSAWSSYCTIVRSTDYTPLSDVCASSHLPLSSAVIDKLNASITPAMSPTSTQTTRVTALIQANNGYVSALGGQTTAESNLASAQQKRDALDQPATATLQQLFQSRQAVNAAQQALAVAQQKEQMLIHPSASDIASAQVAVTGAQAGLASAEARAAQTKAGTDPNTVAQQQIAVQLAQQQVDTAREALDGLTLTAPYDGTVGSVAIQAGQRVAASAATINVTDPNAIVVNLTVSETDLPSIKTGELGFATFDALPSERFIVRVDSVSLVPTTAQGVVTYPVQAEILQGQALAGVAAQLRSLAGALGGGTARAGFAGRAGASADATPGARAGGGKGAGAGVRARATAAAGAAGTPGAGRRGVAGGATAGAGAGAGGAAAGGLAAALQDEAMPAPGMSGTITLLTREKTDVLLVPSSAVHTQGRTSFVYVPNADGTPKEQDVVTGDSNGTQVEIASGLNEGDTVLLNVTVPSAAAATTTGGDTAPGGGFGGFGGGGGAGGGRGGATGGLR